MGCNRMGREEVGYLKEIIWNRNRMGWNGRERGGEIKVTCHFNSGMGRGEGKEI